MNNVIDLYTKNQIISRLNSDLKMFGDELKQTAQDSEKEFMFIGSRLQEFFTMTERIAMMSSNITHFLSGLNITETIVRLRELITQMNEYIQDSEIETSKRVEELTHLLSTITSLYTPIEEIKRNIKRLNTLGFATRIHSGTSDGSSILAEDIEKLSSEIVLKKTLILESLQSLAATIEKTLANVSSINENQLQKAWVIVDNTMSSLTSLTEKRAKSTNTAKSISIFSERAFKSVEEIVKFIQFHDITYQEMSHMRDMLYDLDAKVAQVKSGGAAWGEDTIQHISEMEYLCSDRAKQISNLRDTMTSAVNRIIENLSIVNSNIRNVSDDVFELVGKGKSGEQSFLSDMNHSLNSINAAVSDLSENAEQSLGLSKTISSFSETLKEIAAFLENIGRIEDDIELIALNASVRAANRGKGAEALGVIAESIRALLTDIRAETADISNSLRSIISKIENLSALVTKESERDSEIYRRTEVLKTMVDKLYHMNKNFASSLVGIDTDSKKLSESIEKTIQGIHTHVIVSEVCNKIIIELENMGSHAHVLRSATGSPGTDMSLKQKPSKKEVLAPEQARSDGVDTGKIKWKKDEFGDNVELF
jgi:methyl-accepting chemotaxis protein